MARWFSIPRIPATIFRPTSAPSSPRPSCASPRIATSMSSTPRRTSLACRSSPRLFRARTSTRTVMPATSTSTSSKDAFLWIGRGSTGRAARRASASRSSGAHWKTADLRAQARRGSRAPPHRSRARAVPPLAPGAARRRFPETRPVYHINCHSMRSVAGKQSEDGAGSVRRISSLATATARLASRASPSSCAKPRRHGLPGDGERSLQGRRADPRVLDPKAGRHSLQIEINKRLYMDERTLQRMPGFPRSKESGRAAPRADR